MISAEDRDGYWRAVEQNSSAEAYHVALAALGGGASFPSVLDDLVADAQRRVGQLWLDDTWTVAREHAATAVGEHVVERLRATLPPAHHTRPLLVVCAEREWHALPALLLTAHLEHLGHSIVNLGADVSTVALQIAIDDHVPRAVLVSASLASSLIFVRRHVETVRAAGVPVVVGGTAFDTAGLRAERIGATAYASSPAALSAALTALPGSVTAAPDLRSAAAREAYAVATDMEALIARVQTRLTTRFGEQAHVISDQVPHLIGALAAALLSGDDTLVAEARAWLIDVARARGADAVIASMWEELGTQLTEYPRASALL